jgi:hypothetical protein
MRVPVYMQISSLSSDSESAASGTASLRDSEPRGATSGERTGRGSTRALGPSSQDRDELGR